jgi:hypothetical protein
MKSLFPGMIVWFNYQGEKVFDKNPMILFLSFDFNKGLIDGLNLNYLSHYRFKKLFEGFKNPKRYGYHPSIGTNISTVPPAVSNLISEDYTFINLPPVSQLDRALSRSEMRVEMKRMYERFIGPNFNDAYRSYTPSAMKSKKIVNLKDY